MTITLSLLITAAIIFACFGLGWLLAWAWERWRNPLRVATRPDPDRQIITMVTAESVRAGSLMYVDSDGYLRRARPGKAEAEVLGHMREPGSVEVIWPPR